MQSSPTQRTKLDYWHTLCYAWAINKVKDVINITADLAPVKANLHRWRSNH